jgi:biopolymer transport protein ExbD
MHSQSTKYKKVMNIMAIIRTFTIKIVEIHIKKR